MLCGAQAAFEISPKETSAQVHNSKKPHVLCQGAIPEQEKFHTGKGWRVAQARSLRFCLKDEVNGERLAIRDGDFLVPRAIDLMPGGNCVFSWGKIRQRESAIFSRYRKMAGLQNHKIGLHPGVNVAQSRNNLSG